MLMFFRNDDDNYFAHLEEEENYDYDNYYDDYDGENFDEDDVDDDDANLDLSGLFSDPSSPALHR